MSEREQLVGVSTDLKSTGNGAKALIAVVDDEPVICRAFRRLLLSAGLECETFSSGEDFLQAHCARTPDCLLLDLHMPGLSGLDVLGNLKATGVSLPVVLMTGRDELGVREKASAAGAAAYLCKPVEDQQLIGTVLEVMEHMGPDETKCQLRDEIATSIHRTRPSCQDL